MIHHLNKIKDQEIEKILENLCPNTSWNISAYAKQGASANILLCESAQKKLIARLSDPSRPGANIPLEYHCQQQASNLGVGPQVYYANDKENVTIMDYVASASTQKLVANLEAKKLAKGIEILHNSESFPNTHSIFDIINMIGNAIGPAFSEYTELGGCLQLVKKYIDIVHVDEDQRPSHRDLHSFNLLCDEQHTYYFIDWEAAGNESFYFDLAVAYNTIVCLNKALSPQAWLTAYFSREASELELNKFAIMRVIALIHYGLIGLYISTAKAEQKISLEKLHTLPSYKHYIQQQIKQDNPDLSGNYLAFGLSCLQAALSLNKGITAHANC
jgi:thiamine kinase-like enzyme